MELVADQIDWPGLIRALILLITAITLAINVWNQHQLAEHSKKIDKINDVIQQQLEGKVDKPTP